MSSTDSSDINFLSVQFNGMKGTFPATVLFPLNIADEVIIEVLNKYYKHLNNYSSTLMRSNSCDNMVNVIFSSDYARAKKAEYLAMNNILSSNEEQLNIDVTILYSYLGGEGCPISCIKTEYIIL
jgi:hypothetical protein